MNTLALGPSWLDPDYLLNTFGLPGLLLIVFAESGLLIGFFLPGDSLLFTTGLLVTTGDLKYPLWLVCVLVALAAIIGDQVGYLFGRKVGPALFKRPDSRLFKQENVEKAHEFFEKYGPKSLVLARFVPIVRTFTPIIAGVSRMNYRSFITYNIIGGILWGVGVTVLGAALGKIDFVHENIEMILILIVLISVVPIVIEFLRARSRSKKEGAAQQQGDDQGPSGDGPTAGPHGGADNDGRGPAAHLYTADQAGQYGGTPYGTGQAGGYTTDQGAPYGTDQGAPYGGGQYGGQAGPGQYGGGQAGQYGGQGAQYGPPQGGGQYGAGPAGGQYGAGQGQYGEQQYGQYGGAQGGQYGTGHGQHGGDQGAQYGGGRYSGEQGARYGEQPGQYGGGQGGQYGHGQAEQYGSADQTAQYGGGQGGQGDPYGSQPTPYDAGQDGAYGAARPGQYSESGPYGDEPPAGRGDGRQDDPGQYGWQDRR
ncbi:DedA family protein [Streptomyces sp. NPDC005752]|uniref:DedA family protein n=1 Tax=Streptomyces sp. NPDC005752 TaxID=3157065 RepID=UPI0033E7916E